MNSMVALSEGLSGLRDSKTCLIKQNHFKTKKDESKKSKKFHIRYALNIPLPLEYNILTCIIFTYIAIIIYSLIYFI